MSTIADYSVFTKAFLASKDVNFSELSFPPISQDNSMRAFAVVPLKLDTPLTPREAMNFDWSKLGSGTVSMWDRVSCRDANGNFIGNIVRVQPGVREGSIRLVAKVAVTASGKDVADTKFNTFVLLRTDSILSQDLPIAVATISDGYRLHQHIAKGNDPLDDVENANYVSFTINHLNGYTSVDFNPDAYATYDDVANALSRGIDGLHIAFDTASGDLKLLDKDGNVLDQANLPIKADVIIADGEEGYKYVKTDVAQDIHAAKAWMPKGKTAWEDVQRVEYTKQHAALVVGNASTPASREFVALKSDYRRPISTESVRFDHVVINDSTYILVDKTETNCTLLKVKGGAGAEIAISSVNISDKNVTLNGQPYVIKNGTVEVDVIKEQDVVTYMLVGPTGSEEFHAYPINGPFNYVYIGRIVSGGSSVDRVLGITLDGTSLYTFDETPSMIQNISGESVRWLVTKAIPGGSSLKYGLEAFVWTVKDREVKLDEPFFKQLNDSLLALGFHEGDDIALGTNLAILAPTEGGSPLNGVDADEYMHGETKNESGKTNKELREQEVNTQRANAKEELVAWNAQHPDLAADQSNGTIIDHTGLDVRNGRITLGCGRVGADDDDAFHNINYGIRMNDLDEHLDFTISRAAGKVQFDDNGHATGLTSATLLSIEAGDYISGAPTCLILAGVGRNSSGRPEVSSVRTTTGFEFIHSYEEGSGSRVTIHDFRPNISAVFNTYNLEHIPAIIEVQAIYTHPNAQLETVPAQQMHTYIGEWTNISDSGGIVPDHPGCIFSCNKIEEWMTAVGLADPITAKDVKLYVVIRVY